MSSRVYLCSFAESRCIAQKTEVVMEGVAEGVTVSPKHTNCSQTNLAKEWLNTKKMLANSSESQLNVVGALQHEGHLCREY